MGEVLRVELVGSDAELGRIPAADVARLLVGVERAVARAASRQVGHRAGVGRRLRAVEETTHFRLGGVDHGSLVVDLELPDITADREELALEDERLGERAVSATLGLLAASWDPQTDPSGEVSAALARLGDELGVGTRYERLEFQFRGEVRGVLDSRRRDRVREWATATEAQREDIVVGTLFEANFEQHTAQLRTSGGQQVQVRFLEDHADDVQAWLRRQADVEGIVRYDRELGVALSIELREIGRPTQLAIGRTDDFWRPVSVEARAAEMGIQPVNDVSELYDADASAEEVDAFLRAIDALP